MTFGQRLKKLREESEITQKSLAQLLKVPSYMIDIWESDKSIPPQDVLENISKLFDISIEKLMESSAEEVKSENSQKSYVAKFTTQYSKELTTDAFKSIEYKPQLIFMIIELAIIVIAIIHTIRIAVAVNMDREPGAVALTVLDAIFSYFQCIGVSIAYFIVSSKIKKKIKMNSELLGNCFQEIYVYSNKLEVAEVGRIKRKFTLLFKNIKTITETENYYIIESYSKEIIIADKSNCDGDIEYLARVKLKRGLHKIKKLVLDCKDNTYSKPDLLRKKYTSLLLAGASIASIWLGAATSKMCLVSGETINVLSGIPYFYTATCMLYFLPISISSIIYGIKNKQKGLEYKLNIITGIVVSIFLILFNTVVALGIAKVE